MPRKKKFNRIPGKEYDTLVHSIEVNDIKSDLKVKFTIDNGDGTFNIQTKLTTVQIDANNSDRIDAVIQTLGLMIRQAADDCLKRRKEIYEALPQEVTGQMAIES